MILGPGAYTVEAIRAAEARAGEAPLMARAAAGLADVLRDELRDRTGGVRGRDIVAAIGGGNNGGDGLFALAELARAGVRVRYWLTSERADSSNEAGEPRPPSEAGGSRSLSEADGSRSSNETGEPRPLSESDGSRSLSEAVGRVEGSSPAAHPEGLAALVAAGGRRIDATSAIDALADADLVLDAVFGIGGRPGLRREVAVFAAACHDLDVPVVSVDLPSGLDADAARPTGASFRATTTVTFGAKKLCHVLQPARSRCGRIVVVAIGLDLDDPAVREFTLAELCAYLPVPGPESDKYSRGVVGLDTGSPSYIGAGILSATGAVYSGAGMVRFCGRKAGPVRLALPNVVVGDGRCQAWVLGSGWGEREDARERIAEILERHVPTVLDADTLHAELLPARLRPDVVLTPHAGELARLISRERDEIAADPLTAITEASQRWGCTVLLKGATQYVAAPGFGCSVAIPGPAWTAQAGSGDVLGGMVGTMLGAGLRPPIAALVAASLQALAADRAAGTYPPQDVARELPRLFAELAEL